MRRRDLFVGLAASGLLSRLAAAKEKEDDMIVVSLDSWKTFANVKGLEPAFEYLSRLEPAQLTPGRTPIITKLVSDARRDEVIERIRAQRDLDLPIMAVERLALSFITFQVMGGAEIHGNRDFKH